MKTKLLKTHQLKNLYKQKNYMRANHLLSNLHINLKINLSNNFKYKISTNRKASKNKVHKRNFKLYQNPESIFKKTPPLLKISFNKLPKWIMNKNINKRQIS